MSTGVNPAAVLLKVLSGLYDRSVVIAPAAAFEPSAAVPAVIASYQSDSGDPLGLWICSMAAAAHLGAALSLLPKAVADDCARRNRLEDNLVDNFREVANVCSVVIAECLGERALLSGMQERAAAIPSELAAFVKTTKRFDLSVDVAGYGKGPVSLRLPKR